MKAAHRTERVGVVLGVGAVYAATVVVEVLFPPRLTHCCSGWCRHRVAKRHSPLILCYVHYLENMPVGPSISDLT